MLGQRGWGLPPAPGRPTPGTWRIRDSVLGVATPLGSVPCPLPPSCPPPGVRTNCTGPGQVGVAGLPFLCPQKRGQGEFPPQVRDLWAGSGFPAAQSWGDAAGHVLRHPALCPPHPTHAQNHGAAGPEPRDQINLCGVQPWGRYF